MPIVKVSHNSFNKYNVVTGSGTYNLPKEDVSTVYGPGWPIAPVVRPEDNDLPREIDYPVAINATLQPRIGYEGLMPVSALKAAYVNVSEVSTPVNLIIRELSGFVPMLKNKSSKQLVTSHPYSWMTSSPDRSVPFNVWLSRFKKSAKVYAAPAFYLRKDNVGRVDAMEYIDGSTLFLIINSRGKLPEPNEVDPEVLQYVNQIKQELASPGGSFTHNLPSVVRKYLTKARERTERGKELPITTPAFTQIIKGIPFSFWDKSEIYFVPEPPAPSVDSPYGETYIERSFTWIQVIALLTAFELGHYRTGNMPEGFASMPKEWFPTMTKLALAEKEFNSRMASGSQTQHARIRFGPEGMKYIPTKKPDFPDKLYSIARHNIYYALGVPTSEIGERSSRGLGGKGFEQGAAHDVSRQILEAEKKSVEEAFNSVLAREGVDDVVFYLDYPQEEIDPTLQQTALWNQLMHGTMTLNDVLTAQNKDPIGSVDDKDNIANMHLFVAGTSIFVIEKMVADESGMIAPAKEPPQIGGSPAGPEDALGDKKNDPKDPKVVEKMMRDLELTGGKSLSTTTYSLPSPKLMEKVDIVSHDGAMVALMMPEGAANELRKIADGLSLPEDAELELAENMHLTLAFLAKDADAEIFGRPGVEGSILSCVKSVAESCSAIVGNIQGYGVFNGEGGMHVLYATLDCPWLPELRQAVCAELERRGLEYGRDHGFVPHVTLAYFPSTWKLPEGLMVPNIDILIDELSFVVGNRRQSFKFGGQLVEKVDWADYFKHCGVCPGDEEWFNAPISRDVSFFAPPGVSDAGLDFVAMSPEGLPPRPALWKPEGDERVDVMARGIGGPQYVREEAAWLLSQCLGFPLVPLSYTSEIEGELGAVVWFTDGAQFPSLNLVNYDPSWIEMAAVLDYVLSHLDRGPGRNYVTHPDDPSRMVLVNNGLSLPGNDGIEGSSIFCDWMMGKDLSPGSLTALEMCLGDGSTWADILDTLSVGGNDSNAKKSVDRARERVQRLLDNKKI